MPFPPHLKQPSAWEEAAASTSDVPAMWRALPRPSRATGLIEMWGWTSRHRGEDHWSAWWEAGLPVDAPFALPAAAPTRIRQPGDDRKTCLTTVLGHALRQKFVPLARAALHHGADPNAAASLVGINHTERAPVAACASQINAEERPGLLRVLLAHGWDPALRFDAASSFLGWTVRGGRVDDLETVALARPDIDWDAVDRRPGASSDRTLLASLPFLGGAENGLLKEALVRTAHWLLDHGANPLQASVPDRTALLLKAIDWEEGGLLERLAIPGMPASEAVRALIASDPKADFELERLRQRRSRGMALLDGLQLRELLPAPSVSASGRLRL